MSPNWILIINYSHKIRTTKLSNFSNQNGHKIGYKVYLFSVPSYTCWCIAISL